MLQRIFYFSGIFKYWPTVKIHEESNMLKTRDTINKLSYHLEERVKELNCLYSISALFEKPGISIEEVLQGTINAIPAALQYPDIACVRIIFGKHRYVTSGFEESEWKMQKEVTQGREEKGVLEVFYKEERPSLYNGPFAEEEDKLITVVAEKISKMIRIIHAGKAIIESEELYRVTAEHVTDGVAVLQDGMIIFSNASFNELFDSSFGKEESVQDLVSSGCIKCASDLFESKESFTEDEKTILTSCISRNNRELWIEGERVIIPYRGRPAILLTLRDCTDRIIRENAIKEETKILRQENIVLRSSMKERYRFRNIIGKSKVMQELYEIIIKAAATDANVAISGESGTGKELAARAIHDLSSRCKKEFVTVNCGAIPENLLEGEFFGHKKGSFTGAYSDKLGYLDIADEGTLFLDEAGELTLNMQIKLLRAIDGKDYMPVGSNRSKKSNFRIIAATNRNLMDLVKNGDMREDFYYRIHVIPVTIPSLKERREDIPLLVDHFMAMYFTDDKRPLIPSKVMDLMIAYQWPGNIRELQNAIRRYLSVGSWDFFESSQIGDRNNIISNVNNDKTLNELERAAVKNALEQNRWNRTMTARYLGISRRALFRKIKKYGLE